MAYLCFNHFYSIIIFTAEKFFSLPQLLYPTAAAAAAAAAAGNPLMNTLNGLQNTTSLAGAGQVNTSQTQQQYIDYATLAAVAAAGGAATAATQNPFSLHPAGMQISITSLNE